MTLHRWLVAGCFAALGLGIAWAADNNFGTPGGATAPGAVVMCLNTSSQAVACSSSTPMPVTVDPGGTVTVGSAGTAAPGVTTVQGVLGMVPVVENDKGNISSGNGIGTCGASCNATSLMSADVSGYSEVSVQLTAAGTGTITFQQSNDNATWLTAQCYTITSTGASSPAVTTMTAVGATKCITSLRYFRAQFTAYTNGTFTAYWVASKTSQVQTQSSYATNINQYGAGQTAIMGNATGTTGAVVGTLASAASVTTYICGFDVSAIGGSAPVGPITIANTITTGMTFQWSSAPSGATLSRTFTPCIPASAAATAITITTTANASATAVDVNSWGFRQ